MPSAFQYDSNAKTFHPFERLSDVTKLSAHVTRVLGQNPGLMTLQGTNSYLLQPPSSPLAPLILIDTSSPHTSQQYVDLLVTHLHHLGLESGIREVHFESAYAADALKHLPNGQNSDEVKAELLAIRAADPRAHEADIAEYGPGSQWITDTSRMTRERGLPPIEHIILTHRHLDHVGALPALLTQLDKLKLPPPRIWKLPSPDELELGTNDRDRPTTDAALVNSLPQGIYTPFSPFQPLHPIMPGLMISIIDPEYRHLLKHDKDGKPRWNEVPEIARVSVRCLKTPGHTQDSVSLVMCEGEKGVFTGDTVLGEGTTIFTDLTAYMLSLKTLLAIKPQCLYPAHGKHIPGASAAAAHIEAYITHRQLREEQILELLTSLYRGFGKEKSGEAIGLQSRMQEYFVRKKEAERKKVKETKEFYSGRPYIPKSQKEKEKAAGKDGDADAGGGGGDGMPPRPGTPPPRRRKGQEDEHEPEEDDPSLDTRHTHFESPNATLQILTRLLYDTTDEKLIFAACRPVFAHLQKLEKEGKVRRVEVRMPKVIDMEVVHDATGPADEAWEIIFP